MGSSAKCYFLAIQRAHRRLRSGRGNPEFINHHTANSEAPRRGCALFIYIFRYIDLDLIYLSRAISGSEQWSDLELAIGSNARIENKIQNKSG